MRLIVDLDLRQVVTGLGVRQVIPALYLTRGDALDLEVQFSRGGVAVDLGTPTLFFCVKTVGDYDGAPLALCTSFTKVGMGDGAYWVGNPDLNTNELNAALGVGAGADLASVTANCEIGYTLAGRQTTTRAIACIVENDLYRGDEGVPTSSVCHVTAQPGAGPAASGTALINAMAAAKLLTPNGAPISPSNRAVLFVPPGRYDLGSDGISTIPGLDIIGSTGDPRHVLITSNRNPIVDEYHPSDDDGNPLPLSNPGSTITLVGDSMAKGVTIENRNTINYGDTNTLGGEAFSAVGTAHRLVDVILLGQQQTAQTLNGAYTNVKGLGRIGGSVDMLGRFAGCDLVLGGIGTLSGSFTDCTGYGYIIMSGTFTGCSISTFNRISGVLRYCTNFFAYQVSGPQCSIHSSDFSDPPPARNGGAKIKRSFYFDYELNQLTEINDA